MSRFLLCLYFLGMVHGSFFPFRLETRPDAIRHNLASAVLLPYDADGRRSFSIPDVARNIILAMPLGFLLVAGGLAGSALPSRLLRSGAVALALSVAIEVGQIFTVDRTTSALDVANQVIGSLAGAFIAHAALGARRDALAGRTLRRLRGQPALGPLVVLTVVLAADALYPYGVTLDISTVWTNYKDATWHPLAGRLVWHAVLVERLVPYAALGALAVVALRDPPIVAAPRSTAWLLCAIYAGGLEMAKLFIESRSPDTGHVLTAAVGAMLGVAVVSAGLPLPAVLVVMAGAVLAYAELTPFDFVWSTTHLQARMRDIEWLPFASYYWAEPQRALFDAAKKLLLGGVLGASLRHAGIRAPAAWALPLAALLEAGQLLERSHHVSVGDALILTAGAAGGALLLTRCRLMLGSA